MTTSASLHATNKVHVMRCTHQRPLAKPDVRHYRIRLSDDGMFHWVELGTIRRKGFELHILRYYQVIGPMSPRTIQKHQNELFRMTLGLIATQGINELRLFPSQRAGEIKIELLVRCCSHRTNYTYISQKYKFACEI